MWPTRQLRTECRTLIIFQEPAHVTPAHTQYPSTKKQVTPTINTRTYALQVFYKQGWAQRVNLTINNHPSAPKDTPVYMGPQRRQENITAVLQNVWYHLLTDVMGIFNSHSWTPPGWTHDFWNSVFLQPKLQILSTQRSALRNADHEKLPTGICLWVKCSVDPPESVFYISISYGNNLGNQCIERYYYYSFCLALLSSRLYRKIP